MIHAKKSLGQNFLKSKEALRALVSAGNIEPSDTVLEVGPGKGVLTAELVKVARKVIAIEKDHRLIETLKEQFKHEIESGKLEIIEGDVLEYEPKGDYKIIANIPYYITGEFLRKFLESEHQPKLMVIMVQKEVAERIVAGTRTGNKESILSMSVKAYGIPRYVMTVKAKFFSPEPNVDSAIIAIENISKDFFTDVSEQDFFTIMKAGFAHKRKMLIGNLNEAVKKEVVGGAYEGADLRFGSLKSLGTTQHSSIPNPIFQSSTLKEIFTSVGIPEKVRAEDISLTDWKKLILELTKTI